MKPANRLFLRSGLGLAALAGVVAFAAPAAAFRLFDTDTVQADLDTTLSLGLSWRVQDRDDDIIGIANGGNAYSVNGDDGNLNYGGGLVSRVLKVTSELELRTDQFGAFVRGSAFYDFEVMGDGGDRTDLTIDAKNLVGRRVDLLDAYLWGNFDLGPMPLQVRVGEQVVSWGESTFIQGGINTINPIDVSAIRVPGAELREALKPEGMVWASLGLTENFSVEGLYLYDWEETVIDPTGSYWSTNDFAGEGGKKVMLGWGDVSDQGTAPVDLTLMAVPRGDTREADDQGQFGLALRAFAPGLNDTEFGFFYLRYNSRLPVISARTGTLQGLTAAGTIGAFAPTIIGAATTSILSGSDVPTAVGTAMAATPLGVSDPGAAQAVAGSAAIAAATALAQGGGVPEVIEASGGAGKTAATAYATDRYAKTAHYFTEYPEDIQLLGVSFNTLLGSSGIALQGEVSHRLDAPLQVDDIELLYSALSPLLVANGTASGDARGDPANYQNGVYGLDTEVPGFILRDVTQVQATATKVFGPGLGTDQSVLVAEAAFVQVHNMPDKSDLRLDAPGTYVSGNAVLGPLTHSGKPIEDSDRFADASSWGYRLLYQMTFNNAIGALALAPRVAWSHDVSGNTPGPGGSFLEGRKAVTLGLASNYQNAWSTDLSYTSFFGVGRYNLINDRDFVAFNIKYSF